jgi:hypothetical protein
MTRLHIAATACNQGARSTAFDYLAFKGPDARRHVDSLAVPLRYMARGASRQGGICDV